MTASQNQSSSFQAKIVARLAITQPGSEPALMSVIEGQSIRFGRIKGNDVILDDTQVSRFHSVLNASSTGITLTDLSSTNGTFLNGRRVSTPAVVRGGDQITIGSASILVEALSVDESPFEDDSNQTQAAKLRHVVVTVLVADVCGYTRLSESVPGQDVGEMLRRWFESVAVIVGNKGGEIDKYIGDAVMALWIGSAEESAALARNALLAGKEIIHATSALGTSASWTHQERFPWTCRVCLNTGDALIGALGNRHSREFTVLGDSVNVAFRLEGLAKSLGHSFVLSATTAELVRAEFELTDLGSSNVKGREEVVGVYGLVMRD